jgi:putative ABC transport system permease protein
MAWTLALRNVWRRPWRFLVMVVALGSGGALLLTSKTTYESLMAATDHALAQEGHDIEIFLQRPAPAAELEAIAAAVPGVARAEAYRRAGIAIIPAIGPASRVDVEGARFTLIGYPEDSRLFTLPVVEGRAPRGAVEVLATRALLGLYPDLALGRPVEVSFRERRATVRITGFVEQIGAPVMYAPPATFDAVTALGDGPLAVRVKAGSKDLNTLAEALDQAFLDARHAPAQVITRTLVRDSLDEHVAVVGGVMRMIALAAALVGAIVLVATVVFNVFERRREVGILRSLGATPERIGKIFIVEAAAITVGAGALAVAGALFITRLMLDAAERSLLRVSVPTQFSVEGLAILAAGALLVMLGVRIALARALQAPVREALAAE